MNRCADATFLIDVVRGDPGAAEKIHEMRATGEALRSPSPAVAELLLGALWHAGTVKHRTLEFAREIETLPIDFDAAAEAARMGAGLLRRGKPLPLVDLLIAATARNHHLALLTRDRGFSNIEDLVVEHY